MNFFGKFVISHPIRGLTIFKFDINGKFSIIIYILKKIFNILIHWLLTTYYLMIII